MTAIRSLIHRLRWIHLAPVLAFVALAAWAFASPIGAAPDDDYHLVSTWCAVGGSAECQPGSSEIYREVDAGFGDVVCYSLHREKSAECQLDGWDAPGSYETHRGNFRGEYPPVYYAVMHVFAGSDIQASALVMRLVNAALFVGLTTTLFALLPASRKRTLLWGWLVAVIPLGIFLIPSNNPSGWAITGVGSAFLALLGWFETTGRRHWTFGALYLLGVVMAAGSRGDAAVYVVGASLTAAIITFARTRAWSLLAILPAIGSALALVFFLSAGQSGVGLVGFSEAPVSISGLAAQPSSSLSGFALVAFNLLELPYLWSGVWGTWALGWFDTGLPAIVPWASIAAFIVVAFAGLGRLHWRKAISVAGVLVVLTVLPVYVLTVGGMEVGESLQPRYLLPLILLLSLLLATMPAERAVRFTRVQTFAIFGALALANFISLQVDIRRYVTGADQQGLNLDAGAEWWWPGLPVGPTAVWIIGALAFTGLLAVLWRPLADQSLALSEATGASR